MKTSSATLNPHLRPKRAQARNRTAGRTRGDQAPPRRRSRASCTLQGRSSQGANRCRLVGAPAAPPSVPVPSLLRSGSPEISTGETECGRQYGPVLSATSETTGRGPIHERRRRVPPRPAVKGRGVHGVNSRPVPFLFVADDQRRAPPVYKLCHKAEHLVLGKSSSGLSHGSLPGGQVKRLDHVAVERAPREIAKHVRSLLEGLLVQ